MLSLIKAYYVIWRDLLSADGRRQRREIQRSWDEWENQMRDKRP